VLPPPPRPLSPAGAAVDPFAEDFGGSADANDPFAEDFKGFKLDPGTSAAGAFVRGAARGAAPSLLSLPAIGPGGQV
jgi:hypothetical protein